MRKVTVAIALALLVTACGGSGSSPSSAAVVDPRPGVTATPGSATPETTATGEPSTDAGNSDNEQGTTSLQPSDPGFDGPPAPDFELALAGGGSFSLSAEQRPTYIVFWAEW